jgi:flagellar biogenesis protein FliO
MRFPNTIFQRWLLHFGKVLRPRVVKQLRLCETLALGERRFLAVVQFGQQKFLIGTAGNSISLLTSLGEQNASSEIEIRGQRTS